MVFTSVFGHFDNEIDMAGLEAMVLTGDIEKIETLRDVPEWLEAGILQRGHRAQYVSGVAGQHFKRWTQLVGL